MIFTVLNMGYQQLLIVCAQPIIFTSIIFFGGKKNIVWITSILLLISYNSMKYKYLFWYYLDREDLQDEEVYLLLFAVAWIQLRCISFTIDYIERRSGTKTENCPSMMETIINLFSYVLYAPILYIGPIILYEDFEKSFVANSQDLTVRLKRFFWDMFLFSCYSFILDYALHYIYFIAMQSDVEV